MVDQQGRQADEVHMQELGSPVRRIPCLPLDMPVRTDGQPKDEMHQTTAHHQRKSIDYIKNV